MIMVCHYLGIVKYASNIKCFHCILIINDSVFSTIIDESFWLQLFFVVSGFLLSYSRIISFKLFLKKIIKRFFRLYLPIAASCGIIFILSETIGFYNSNTRGGFLCDWFQNCYDDRFTVLDLFLGPIKTVVHGGSEFNGPYWVIKDMFYASLVIYFINYISYRLNENIKIMIYILAIIVAKLFLGQIYFSCLVGGISGVILHNNKLIDKFPDIVNGIICIMSIVLPLGGHQFIYNFLCEKINNNSEMYSIISYLKFNSDVYGTLYFAVLIVFITYNKSIKRMLSNTILGDLNKISFGVYSFHWPIICSIGALCMIKTTDIHSGIICGWLISFVITIGISIFYYFYVEINVSKLLKKI